MKAFIFRTLAIVLLITNAWAEHEVDHRYNVRGYVLDDNQQGIANLNVQAFDGRKLLESSTTDSEGFFSLHLHLHNEDNRKRLRLRAGPHEADLRVSFDPEDLSTLRAHDANFVAGKFVEGTLRRFRIPPWIYPLGGLIALGFIAVVLEKRRKKKLRLKNLSAKGQPPPGKHKSKKRRRKKH